MIDQWPAPEAGHTLQLPLLGSVLQVGYGCSLVVDMHIHLRVSERLKFSFPGKLLVLDFSKRMHKSTKSPVMVALI